MADREMTPGERAAIRREALEEAARVADAEADDIASAADLARDSWQQGRQAMARTIANAIRALADAGASAEGRHD